MPYQKIAKQRTFMYLPASINFHDPLAERYQHLVSVKHLETAQKYPSKRVAEVNKFGINHQKQVTHVSGRRKRV